MTRSEPRGKYIPGRGKVEKGLVASISGYVLRLKKKLDLDISKEQ